MSSVVILPIVMSKRCYSTPGNILFITGTDTGVGKTVLTSLLVAHLAAAGRHVFAMKPFCSGGLQDAEILYEAQKRRLPISQISPFHFEPAMAPLLAARQCGRIIHFLDVLEKITTLANRCEQLLVEGAGGLLSPLGEKYSAVELIASLQCPVVVVAANRLGTVNHVLLTLAALRRIPALQCKVVLMNARKPDASARFNKALIRQFAAEEVFSLPYLGRRASCPDIIEESSRNLKKTLAAVAEVRILSTALRKNCAGGKAGGQRKKENNSLAGIRKKSKAIHRFSKQVARSRKRA